MIELRTVETQNELNEAVQLCNNVFFQCDSFFERRYPHVFNLENRAYLFAAFDEQRLVSFIATYLSALLFNEDEFTVCTLGAVCTHETYRGRGLSMLLLEYVQTTLQDHVDLLIISGEGKNYLRFGASIVGKLDEVHVPGEALRVADKSYHVLERFEDVDVRAYHQAYLSESKPKFERGLVEQELMLKGHFETLINEKNTVLVDGDAYACLRIGYEDTVKIAYIIERVGDFDLKILEDYAKKCSCDKLFYRSQHEIIHEHKIYAKPIPITGTIKVIRPKYRLSAIDLFGDSNRNGKHPSFRVDNLNFL